MVAWVVVTVLASLDGGVVITPPPPVDAGVIAAPPYQPVQPQPPPPVQPYAMVDAGTYHDALPAGPKVTLRGAAEASLGLLPSGFAENGADVMLALRPVAGFQVGDDFLIELGPTFRLRLIDFAPDNRSSDPGGILRAADWDEASDFGQILQSLRIAPDSSPFTVRAGPMRKKTLGLGHLINRYSNQENPDYHPAAADVVLSLGPLRGEFFASDVFGPRLFAGDLAWDLGRTFSDNRDVRDRYILALEIAHDASRAGLPFRRDPTQDRFAPPPVTLLHLDGSATLIRTQSLRFMVLAGMGSRSNETADLGFVAGGAVDLNVSGIGLSLKGELRKNAGGFRQGFFGPTFELSRYADTGFSGTPQALASLPNSWSVMGEARLGLGTSTDAELMVEHWFFGRTDADATVDLLAFSNWLVVQLRANVVGLEQTPRWGFSGGLKARLFPSFYVLASGGTSFFPQLDGTLLRGVSGFIGAGVDFER